VVLDEVQYVPDLLPHLKIRIDQDRGARGRFVLTGSQRFHLMRDVSESLAGRVGILELLPFGHLELSSRPDRAIGEILWCGGYPEPALTPGMRDHWARAYVDTYIERDLRQLQNIQDLAAFEQFIQTAATRHGQSLNMAAMARDCGVSKPTIKAWLGALEASYLIALVRPWMKNYGKRLTKAPRLIFLDPIIPGALTRQPSADALVAGAMGGAFFEGLIVSEAIKVYTNLGRRPDVWHWRSNDGLEVDLIVQTPAGLIPVEVKLSASPSTGHTRGLQRFRELAAADVADEALLVCRVDEPRPMPHGITALPWQDFPAWLRERLA
jgi:uncharacterized protein